MTPRVMPLLLVAPLLAASTCALPLDSIGLDAVPRPPAPPTLEPPTTPTSSSTVVLRGTRPANTALALGGEEVAARGASTAFRVPVTLEPGFNTFVLNTIDAAGRVSDDVVLTIARDDVAPAAIGFTTPTSTRTATARLTLTGTKEPSCRVWQDGRLRDDVGLDDPVFPIDEVLVQGANRFRFACTDEAGNESPVTQLDLERREVDAIPFSLDAPDAVIAGTTLALSATCDDDVEAQAGSSAPSRCSGGAWSANVPLLVGRNEFTVRAAFVGELGTAARTFALQVEGTPPVGEGEGEGEGEDR